MLPNLSSLHLTVKPCGTPLPEAATKLLEDEECVVCLEKLGEESSHGPWTGGGRNYVTQCVNDHYVHKMCLAHQLTTGRRLTTCPECREPVHAAVQAMVRSAVPNPPTPDYESDESDGEFIESGDESDGEGGDEGAVHRVLPPPPPPPPRLLPQGADLIRGLGGFTWARYLGHWRTTLIRINAWYYGGQHQGEEVPIATRLRVMRIVDSTREHMENILFGGQSPLTTPHDPLVSGSVEQLAQVDAMLTGTRLLEEARGEGTLPQEVAEQFFRFANTIIEAIKRGDPYLNQQIRLIPGVIPPELGRLYGRILYTWPRFGQPLPDEREAAREAAREEAREAAAREANPLYLHVEVYQRELDIMVAENQQDYDTWPPQRAQQPLVSSIIDDLTKALEHLMFGGRALGLPLIPNGSFAQRTWVHRLIIATEALERYRRDAAIAEQILHRVFIFVNKNIVRMMYGNDALDDLIVLRPGVSDPTHGSWGRPRNYLTWTWTGSEA